MRVAVMMVALLMSSAVLAEDAVPVEVGGNDGLDACMSQGEVTGLDPAGDDFLSVRSGPGTDHAKLDELHTGDIVNVCASEDGWLGVVYGEDCGTGTPIEPRQPYAGPCKSGWVSETYVVIVAG